MKTIYFDNAASTPLFEEVNNLMFDIQKTTFGNPSSTHQEGRKLKAIIEQSRKDIAACIGAQPSEIIFTSGGTEADNMALYNAVRNLNVEVILTSSLEHHAVLKTVEVLSESNEVELILIPNNHLGELDFQFIEEKLAQFGNKCLVSLMWVNNEIGNVLDVEKVGALCKHYHSYFHTDGVQSVGHLPMDLSELNIHFMAASAHKFHGPNGVGFLYVKNNSPFKGFIHGGAQEKGARAGTESPAAIAGMALALKKIHQSFDQAQEKLLALKKYALDQFKKEIPDINFNGLSDRLDFSSPSILNLALRGNQQMMLFQLDMKGIIVSGGSACQSGSNSGSHVIQALNHNQNQTSLRVSFSEFNTKDEIDALVSGIKEMMV